MRDIAGSVNAPSGNIAVPPGGFEALLTKDEAGMMLSDQEDMERILRTELDYFCNKATLKTIALHYRLGEGDEVRINPKWRTETLDVPPMRITNIMGKTTHAGFANMVRAVVIGAAKDLYHRQYRATWCLKSYKLVKRKEEYTQPDVVDGRVVFIGDNTSEKVYREHGITERDVATKKHSTSVYAIELTFVDISNGEEVKYKEGRPADSTSEQAAHTNDVVTELVHALRDGLLKREPVVNESPDAALAYLATSLNIPIDELRTRLLTPPVPAKKTAIDVYWNCPVKGCTFMSDTGNKNAIRKHLQAHVDAKEMTEKELEAELVKWEMWNKQSKR